MSKTGNSKNTSKPYFRSRLTLLYGLLLAIEVLAFIVFVVYCALCLGETNVNEFIFVYVYWAISGLGGIFGLMLCETLAKKIMIFIPILGMAVALKLFISSINKDKQKTLNSENKNNATNDMSNDDDNDDNDDNENIEKDPWEEVNKVVDELLKK